MSSIQLILGNFNQDSLSAAAAAAIWVFSQLAGLLTVANKAVSSAALARKSPGKHLWMSEYFGRLSFNSQRGLNKNQNPVRSVGQNVEIGCSLSEERSKLSLAFSR